MRYSLRLSLILAVIVLGSVPLEAGVVKDTNTGCQITVPDGWKNRSNQPPNADFDVGYYDPALYPSVDFLDIDQAEGNRLTEDSMLVRQCVSFIQLPNSVVTGHNHRTINGQDFLVYSVTNKLNANTNFITVWLTIVKGRVIRIYLTARNADPDKTEVLNQIIKSFAVSAGT